MMQAFEIASYVLGSLVIGAAGGAAAGFVIVWFFPKKEDG